MGAGPVLSLLSIIFISWACPAWGSCFTSDAKWNKGAPRVSQPSATDPSKVQVDWSSIIKNSRCVDKYFLWVWKDGQEKAKGQKYVIADKNTQTKIVQIEPCIFYNFRVELEEDDSSHTDKRDSETARYNSAALPAFNDTQIKKYFTIGYHKDPVSGQFDLTKASIVFDTKFITFANCIKHLEVSGKQKSGAVGLAAAQKTPKTKTTTTTTMNPLGGAGLGARFGSLSWEPYGTGRNPGELGPPPNRGWRSSNNDYGGGYNPGGGGFAGGYNPGGGGYAGGYNPGGGGYAGGYNPGGGGGGNAGYAGGYNPGSGGSGSTGTTTRRPSGTTEWGYNPGIQFPTRKPNSGWGYPTPHIPDFIPTTTRRPSGWNTNTRRPSGVTTRRPSGQTTRRPSGSTTPNFDHPTRRPGFWGTRSGFSNQFLRLVKPASTKVAGPVKKNPPFLGSSVEIVVPVEPCKEYFFDMKIISPQNTEIGKITNLELENLPNIDNYIPPPMTSVMLVKYPAGGKHDISAQPTSPVPESCLPDYMEALDAYANRLEMVANDQEKDNKGTRFYQFLETQKVELTQSETLEREGCVCNSPRLHLGGAPGHNASSIGQAAGVYLYEGIWEGRPYYKQDLNKINYAEFSGLAYKKKSRRKRFIGRVDGGGTTTTKRPWNYGAVGGGYSSSGSRSSSSSTSWSSGGKTHTSSSSSSTSWSSGSGGRTQGSSGRVGGHSGGRGSTGKLGGSRVTTTIIPIQRVTTVAPLVPRFLYWEPTKKQWLISLKVGNKESAAEVGSSPNSSLKCPGDSPSSKWRAPGKSGWAENRALHLYCEIIY